MSVADRGVHAVRNFDGRKYWIALAGVLAAQGLALLVGATLAGLSIAGLLASTPGLVVAEMLLVAILLWPALWLAITSLGDRRTPGWLSLPAIVAAALFIMTTSFGRPFALPVDGPMLHLLPLSLILFAAACVVVEGLGIGRREAAGAKPLEPDLRLAA
jgi:uncharacterized membrane protein YhaH (DUF805 family)